MIHFLVVLSRGILKHSFQSAQALQKKNRYPKSSTQHCEENMSGENEHIWSPEFWWFGMSLL